MAYFLFNCQTTWGCVCTPSSCVCVHAYYVTETVLGVCCTASACESWIWFSVAVFCIQIGAATGSSSNTHSQLHSRPQAYTDTHTHADIHNINRQTFIAGGGCLKSRYTYIYLYTCLCLYVYFLCFLTFVIKCDQFHVIIHVLKGLPRTVKKCVGQPTEPVFQIQFV